MLLRAASLVEYVLVLSCVSLVICLAGPPVADAIQGQFGQVQEVIKNGSTGGSGGGGGDFPGGGSGDEQGGGGENPDKPGGGNTGGGTDPEKPGGGNTGGDTPSDPKPEEKRLGGSVELSPAVVGKVATATANGAQNDAVPGYEWSVEGKTVSTGATWVPSAEYADKGVTVTAADTGGTYTGSISADAVVEQAELTGSIAVAPVEAGVESTAAVDGAPSDADIELAWKVDGAAIGTGDAVTLPDDSEGKTLVVEGRDKSGIYGGVISISLVIKAAPKVAEAFAVFSADDGSLNFYKRVDVPAAGSQFEGKSATEVYTGFEEDRYVFVSTPDSQWGSSTAPWASVQSSIESVTVVDSGIRPKYISLWFANFVNLTDVDVSNLDTSACVAMNNTFFKTRRVQTLDLSAWDVSNVTDFNCMFQECFSLGELNIEGWKARPVNSGCFGVFYDCTALRSLDLSGFDLGQADNANRMFGHCYQLSHVTFGDSWRFVGYGLTEGMDPFPPAPSADIFADADGKWYAASDGKGYAPADIPSNKADTYYASKGLLPAQAKTFSLFGLLSDGIDMLTDMLIGQGA